MKIMSFPQKKIEQESGNVINHVPTARNRENRIQNHPRPKIIFSEFKKHLELYVPSLYDRLLLILHRFYFNSNCDHLLGDLNYTYRQLKKILPNENLFKDMKNTLKSTCIDEDELVRTYDLVW